MQEKQISEEKERKMYDIINDIEWESDMTIKKVIEVTQQEICTPLINMAIQHHKDLCKDWIIERALEYDEISNEALNKVNIDINKINDDCYIIHYRNIDIQCCTKNQCIEFLDNALDKWSHDKVMKLSLMM